MGAACCSRHATPTRCGGCPIGGRGRRPSEPRPTALPVTGPSTRQPRDLGRRPAHRLDRRRIEQRHLVRAWVRRRGAGVARHRRRRLVVLASESGLARGKSGRRRRRPDRVHRQPRQRREQDLPGRAGTRAAPAHDRRPRSLQPVLAEGRERAGGAGQPRRRHRLVAARSRHRSRAAAVLPEGRRATGRPCSRRSSARRRASQSARTSGASP